MSRSAPPLAPEPASLAATLLAARPADEDEVTRRRTELAAAKRFFGLDIHREYMVATAVNANLEVVFGPIRVGWDRFPDWVSRALTPTDAICIEMTTNSWRVYDLLSPHVHSVTVVHPPHLKLITKMPVMNDKRAAEALATLLAAGLLRTIWVPDPATRDRRQLVAQRLDRVKAATIAKNRLQSVLHRHQFDKPEASDPYTRTMRDFWLSLPVSGAEQLAIEMDLETIALCEAQQERIEALIHQEAVKDERLPFLLQLPGVSIVGALTLLAAIGSIERFPSAKHLVGYAGLGARVHDSGNARWSGGITKTGRKDLRYVMVNAAQAATRTHPFWKAELARMEPRLGRNKAIVAIARKLLVSVWHVLTKREADRHAESGHVARAFAAAVYVNVKARNLPDGETGPEFVRRGLDQLQIGKELQTVHYGSRDFILPQSEQPGAAPMAQPRGRGQLQNTRAAKAARAAEAARKKAEIEARRAAATTRSGRPRKPRSDKGQKRGPNKVTKARTAAQAGAKARPVK